MWRKCHVTVSMLNESFCAITLLLHPRPTIPKLPARDGEAVFLRGRGRGLAECAENFAGDLTGHGTPPA
jgi:hypothetical protein